MIKQAVSIAVFALLGCTSRLANIRTEPAGNTQAIRSSSEPCLDAEYPIIAVSASPYIQLSASSGGTTKQGYFLVDLGANTSAIDSHWIDGLSVQNADGYAQLPTFDFGYSQANVQFHVQDLSNFSRINGAQQAGTLGTDFLSEFATDFHFHERRLALFRRATFERCQRSLGLETLMAMPLTNYTDSPRADGPRNIPTVQVSIDGIDVPCQLDTGTSAVDAVPSVKINNALFLRLEASLTPSGAERILAPTGPVSVEVYRPRGVLALRLGQTDINIEKILREPPAAGYPFSAPEPYALIGMPVLARFRRMLVEPFSQRVYFSH